MRMAPKLLYELKTVAKIGYNRNRCIPDTMVREWQRSGQWCGNHRVPGGKLAPAQFRGCGKFAPTYIEAETNRLWRLKSFAPAGEGCRGALGPNITGSCPLPFLHSLRVPPFRDIPLSLVASSSLLSPVPLPPSPRSRVGLTLTHVLRKLVGNRHLPAPTPGGFTIWNL